jgi:DNA polymerase-3 subunit delta'
MAWQGVEGHDHVASRFIVAAERGRIAGSYLFVGPPGVGKDTFARSLAKSLLCLDHGNPSRPPLTACGNCASCVQAEAGTHPDIDLVAKPEDRATIPLEAFIGDAAHRMRDGLCWRLLLRPALGGRKIAIIRDADHLSDEAANCLLKTLEEPPPGAVIVLVGTALERQLPTIRSRCQIVRFRPLPDEVVARILAAEIRGTGGQVDAARMQACAVAAEGSLQRGRLLLDPALGDFRSRLTAVLGERPIRGVDLAKETIALVEAAGKEAPPRRARLRIVLESAVEFFRAALRRDALGEAPTEPALARAVAAWGGRSEDLVTALDCTLDALQAVERNANLTVLVDAWTAVVEEPRLAQTT